jgi:hypothetical protein
LSVDRHNEDRLGGYQESFPNCSLQRGSFANENSYQSGRGIVPGTIDQRSAEVCFAAGVEREDLGISRPDNPSWSAYLADFQVHNTPPDGRWVIDFYSMDFIDKNPVIRTMIRANRGVRNKPDNNGDNFTSFIHTWDLMGCEVKDEVLETNTKFKQSLASIIGANSPAVDKMLPILRHQAFFDMSCNFTEMPWGRALYSIANTHFHCCLLSRLDMPSVLY